MIKLYLTLGVFLFLLAPTYVFSKVKIFLFSFESTESVTFGSGTFSANGVSNPAYNTGVSGKDRTYDSWNTNDYYQFRTSTTGLTCLTFSFYDRTSNASIGQFQLQYSTDGTTWINEGGTFSPPVGAFQPLNSPRTFDLPSVCENQPILILRIRKVNNADISGRTYRIDEAMLMGGMIVSPIPPRPAVTQSSLTAVTKSKKDITTGWIKQNTIELKWAGGTGTNMVAMISTSPFWVGLPPLRKYKYLGNLDYKGSADFLGGGKVVYAGDVPPSNGSITIYNIDTTKFKFYLCTTNYDSIIDTTGCIPMGVDWEFTVIDIDFPLPVEGMQLSATLQNTQVLLQWQTSKEDDNMGFDVERSSDGYLFEKLSFIPSDLYSSSLKNYQYIDKTPIVGKSYYRLNQKDLDGKNSLSNIIEVVFNPPIAIQAFPNPTQHSFSLSGYVHSNILQLSAYNIEGKEILKLQGNSLEQLNSQLQAKILAPGMYQVLIKDGNSNHLLKLIVE